MDDYIISFYNEKKEKKDFTIDKYFNCGSYGYVYKIDDDKCLKLFSEEFYFQPDVLKIIRDLKLNNFYEIYDILYDEDKMFIGYTMKYYEEDDIDITTMPIEYTLDNLYHLKESIKKLTSRHVAMLDCNSDNVIMDERNIIMIDADMYYIDEELNRKELLSDNYWALMGLFQSLYYDRVKSLGYSSTDNEYLLKTLFDEEDILNTEKRLIKYRYPIDYIKDFYKGRC